MSTLTRNREELIQRILSNKTAESLIANRIHSILDRDAKFAGKELKDFLEDKKLFDEAKKEIYDILIQEHQRYFNIAERILWGTPQERKKLDKVRENKEYEEAFKAISTHDLFIGLKQRSKDSSSIIKNMNRNFLIRRALAATAIIAAVRKEVQAKTGEAPSLEDLRAAMEHTFSDETLSSLDPLNLATLIINNLKRYAKAMGFE